MTAPDVGAVVIETVFPGTFDATVVGNLSVVVVALQQVMLSVLPFPEFLAAIPNVAFRRIQCTSVYQRGICVMVGQLSDGTRVNVRAQALVTSNNPGVIRVDDAGAVCTAGSVGVVVSGVSVGNGARLGVKYRLCSQF